MNSVIPSRSASREPLQQRLQRCILALGLARPETLSAFRFKWKIYVIEALNGSLRFRADRQRREPLAELERLFHEIAGLALPVQSLPEVIELAARDSERVIRTTLFAAVLIRGPGDVLLIVRDRRHVDKVNAVLRTRFH